MPKTKTLPGFFDTGLLVLRLEPVVKLTAEQLYEFCRLNSDIRIELNAEGDLEIMPPTGGETGIRNGEITAQLVVWARTDGTGLAFEADTGFMLRVRTMRSPDGAWIQRSRWEALPKEQRARFAPICPDFVIELRSPSDIPERLQAKMREYIEAGARLGWLIDPMQGLLYIYRPGERAERLERPASVSGDPVLPGFVLDLARIWEP